jgi:GNAT superfamily N-acetyltransferase
MPAQARRTRGPGRNARGRSGASRRPTAGRPRLRWATVDDLGLLVRHRRLMWRALRRYRREELDRHDVAYRRWLRRGLADGELLALVAEDGGGRALASGALWLMPSQPRPGPLGRGRVPYVLSMFTEPGARGRGLASRIVREMIAWARSHGYPRIVLHASRFGRPVYERLGFEPGSEMRRTLRGVAKRRGSSAA